MDNALEFRGANRSPRSFGQVVRVAVDIGTEPLFNPPHEPWRNGGVERHNGFLEDRLLTIDFDDFTALTKEVHVCQDENTLETLRYRMDWRQFCDLPLDARIPDRTPLVKFRRQVGLEVVEEMFHAFLDEVVRRRLLDLQHRFFDGTPAKARARINPYRDEIYEETLAALEEKLRQFHTRQIECDPSFNATPVQLTKTAYAADNAAVETRWEQP